jgi:4-amino-4-deoxychorismate lyase
MKQFVETIRIEKGVPMLLEQHLARLHNTALHYFGTNLEIPDLPSLLLSELKDEVVKCRILYSDKIENIEFGTYKKRNIQKLKIVHDNNIDYIYKSTNRKSLDALLEQKGDADEIIIIKNGFVTDTSFSNLLFENEDGFFTPNSFLLNGVQRQNLIKSGLIQELAIRENDIWRFTKIHLINAMLLPGEIVVDINEVR